MKATATLAALALLPCCAAPAPTKKMRVCLTTYHKTEDPWTRRGLTSTGAKLEDGKSAAVDPAIIPYGSTITLEACGMELTAVDTGSAVKSRKAARLRGEPDTPVVDIYFNDKSDALAFANGGPYFTEAKIRN